MNLINNLLLDVISILTGVAISYFIIRLMKNQTKIIVDGELIEVSDYLESSDNKTQQS